MAINTPATAIFMLLQRRHSRACRKTHKTRSQAQRVFKTAPLYAVTNPEESAPQDIWTAFTSFFESLWSPSTNPDGSTVQKAGMSYVYDEDGTLIAQTLTGGAQSSWGQSARYVYLPTASGSMPVAAIYGTKHYAVQSDHLNTPRRLIQSDGQVAWQWAYSAFGEEKPTTAKTRFANTELNQSFGTSTVPAVTFNLRYPGQYFDQESNLHYNGHRSYCPGCGRYTQADPIDLQGGWNRFSYVGQNPLSFTDPLGLYTEVILWANSPGFTGSWGHISGNINGQNYSFGPGGWDTRYQTAQQYADRQKSSDIDREGRGTILDLSPIEEAKLASCLKKANNYHGMNNNCGSPWLQCLDEMGITHSGNRPSVLPVDVMKIIGGSKRAKGNTSYPGKRPLY